MSFLQRDVPSPRALLASLRRRARRPERPERPTATGRRTRRGGAGRRPVTGLDIESSFVAAVETVPGSVAVRRAAVADMPPDLVRDGEVLDPEALGRFLADFFSEHGLSPRVRIGLANQQNVMRIVNLPPITDEKQLASAVQFQAQEHIPMPLDQAVLDWQSLGLVGTAEGPRSQVMLVAARRELVERLLGATRTAGLRLEGIDLSAFALIRAMHRAGDGEAPIAYVNVSSMTNVAVAVGTQCTFRRVVSPGFDALVGDLAARRGLTLEHARGWLRFVGLAVPVAEIDSDHPEVVAAARDVLEEGIARIANELRATLDFVGTQEAGLITERLVVTGPATSIDGFVERIAADVDLPVEVRTVPEGVPGGFGSADPGQLTVAAGLTVTDAPT